MLGNRNPQYAPGESMAQLYVSTPSESDANIAASSRFSLTIFGLLSDDNTSNPFYLAYFSTACLTMSFSSTTRIIEVSFVHINIDAGRPHHGRARPPHRPAGHYRRSGLVKQNNRDN